MVNQIILAPIETQAKKYHLLKMVRTQYCSVWHVILSNGLLFHRWWRWWTKETFACFGGYLFWRCSSRSPTKRSPDWATRVQHSVSITYISVRTIYVSMITLRLYWTLYWTCVCFRGEWNAVATNPMNYMVRIFNFGNDLSYLFDTGPYIINVLVFLY